MKHDWAGHVLRNPITWGVTAGVTGYLCGYHGNFLLAANPGSVAPVVGILLTGPGGLGLGIVLSLFLFRRPMSNVTRACALAVFLLLVALGSLGLTIPNYFHEAELVESDVIACEELGPLVEERIPYWRSEVDRVSVNSLARVREEWEDAIPEMVSRRLAVVLTLRLSKGSWLLERRWRGGTVNRRFSAWKENGRDEKVLLWDIDRCSSVPRQQGRYFLDIPAHPEQRFRPKVNTRSGSSRTLVPGSRAPIPGS